MGLLVGSRASTTLFERASQYEKRNLGRTYVAIKRENPRVWGYYTIASSALAFEELPQELARKLPKHPIPVILLGRLAVDQTMQVSDWARSSSSTH